MQPLDISPNEKRQLLAWARQAIEQHCCGEHLTVDVNSAQLTAKLKSHLACFVSLNGPGDQLRGCIGHLEPYQSLYLDVIDNAVSAAFNDGRFKPVTATELATLEISISVLGDIHPIMACSRAALESRLQSEKPGVIFKQGGMRSVFLPHVWQQLPQAQAFVDALLRKGGWASWSEKISVSLFDVINFDEKISMC